MMAKKIIEKPVRIEIESVTWLKGWNFSRLTREYSRFRTGPRNVWGFKAPSHYISKEQLCLGRRIVRKHQSKSPLACTSSAVHIAEYVIHPSVEVPWLWERFQTVWIVVGDNMYYEADSYWAAKWYGVSYKVVARIQFVKPYEGRMLSAQTDSIIKTIGNL
jgi:hypothetical protein